MSPVPAPSGALDRSSLGTSRARSGGRNPSEVLVSFAAIAKTLAKEFSVEPEHAQRVFELLESGYKVPTITRYRRAEIGSFTEGTVRRFARRLKQIEELEKRRSTLLKSIEEQRRSAGDEGAPGDLEALRTCIDRYQLEDLFLPHRRPEPEVQLAIDRGLDPLADEIVAPAPGSMETDSTETSADEEDEVDDAVAQEADEGETNGQIEEEEASQSDPESDESPADSAKDDVPDEEAGPEESAPKKGPKEPKKHVEHPVHGLHIDLSPQLARACAPYVNPDRGIHTDEQALEGAVRILSDRLGRNPHLRGALRRAMLKNGRLTVRALVSEKELGRNRSLLKINTPLRQLQGHRLLALRQAQAQRQIAIHISIDEGLVLPKVRAALGKRTRPEFASVADAVAEQALRQRLLPMIEDEVRNELRERADEEALRFLAQHLRQVLLTSPAGARPCAGVHIDAKGDWLIVVVDRDGNPVGEEVKIAAGSQEPPQLAEALGSALRDSGVRDLVVESSKPIRDSVRKLRETIHLLGADATVFLVNEAGLSNYANSEPGRRELPERTVHARQAIGLARRHQDPLLEFLKADPRHLGLGREQSVVSKANLRRLLHDTIESCVAHVGCDLNTAPLVFLRHVPGLNYELAKKLVERRSERTFSSREELRTEALLDDLTWTNAIGFLRVQDSPEPLDRTGLHPEQYDFVRRVILESGRSVDEALGQRDAARGLRRGDHDTDEYTWRDIVRELAYPGRDPRPRQFLPHMLPPDTDPKELAKGQIVEGIVSNVTSFGAFVDLGLTREGMIHISEISSRYVRDARALLSIGQVVRARVLDGSGPRVELSLKNVPDGRRRPGGGEHGPRGGAERGGGTERGDGKGRRSRRGEKGKEGAWPEYQPVMRAARSRRDGLAGSKPDRERRGQGGGRSPGRGPGRGAGGRRERDDQYDPSAVREASRAQAQYNPFASFFRDQKSESPQESAPERTEKTTAEKTEEQE